MAVDNDRWRGVCSLYENATYEYTVEAWTERSAAGSMSLAAKFEAGLADLTSEKLEGAALLEAAARRAREPRRGRLRELAERDPHG